MASAPVSLRPCRPFQARDRIRQKNTLEITRTLQHDRGRRIIKAEKKWTKQEDLGYGTFGEVWLEKNQFVGARAVKGIKKKRNTGIGYHKELLAMAKLSKVWGGLVTFKSSAKIHSIKICLCSSTVRLLSPEKLYEIN